jgi:hypothetical protein
MERSYAGSKSAAAGRLALPAPVQGKALCSPLRATVEAHILLAVAEDVCADEHR